jgi:hypothetical protein
MSKKKITEPEAPTIAFHQRAYQKFEAKSQDERVIELVKIGILTEDRELSPRYGGKPEKRRRVEATSG